MSTPACDPPGSSLMLATVSVIPCLRGAGAYKSTTRYFVFVTFGDFVAVGDPTTLLTSVVFPGAVLQLQVWNIIFEFWWLGDGALTVAPSRYWLTVGVALHHVRADGVGDLLWCLMTLQCSPRCWLTVWAFVAFW